MDDEELLVAARSDDMAFGAFYKRHVNAVLAYFYRHTIDRDIAADLTQETFASVLRTLSTYDPQKGSAQTWVQTLARRRMTDAWRRGKVDDRARKKLSMEPFVLRDDELERAEERVDVAQRGGAQAMLGHLSAEQREAVEGRVINKESYGELAQRLRCSESVVRQRVHRGLSKLRRRFGEL